MQALVSETRKPPASWFVRATTFGLMAYLQNSIDKQLKWLYPTNPQNADKWLEQEIYRWGCSTASGHVKAQGSRSAFCITGRLRDPARS